MDGFDGLVLVLSPNADERSLIELQQAVTCGMATVPFVIGQHLVPDPFRDLIGSVHWVSDQGLPLGTEIELAKRTLQRMAVRRGNERAGHAGTDRYVAAPTTVARVETLRRLARLGFYAAVALFGGGAAQCAVAHIVILSAHWNALSPANFLLVVVVRVGGLIIAAGLFYISYGWGGEVAEGRQSWWWPVGGIVVGVAGLASAFVRSVYGSPEAAAVDLGASALILTATASGLRIAMQIDARRPARADAMSAARVKAWGRADRLRFVRNNALEKWFAIAGMVGAFTSMGAGMADSQTLKEPTTLIVLALVKESEAQQDLNNSLILLHVFLAFAPISVLFLAWLGRAWRNSAALGFETLSSTMTGAVPTFANPLVNIGLGPVIVRELVGGQRLLVNVWWASVLLYWTSLWARFGANIDVRPRFLIGVDAAACCLFIVAAMLTYVVVARVNRKQNELSERR